MSFTVGFRSSWCVALASSGRGSNDARPSAHSASLDMAKSTNLVPNDAPNYPPMAPVAVPEVPFLARIYEVSCKWTQDEWFIIEAIKREATRSGKNKNVGAAIMDARLTPQNLAKHLDNISHATLCRFLKNHKAPTPSAIIRQTRLHFARHLLTHTRLLVRDVALRAGYEDERYFSSMFQQEFSCLPSEFRRVHVKTKSPSGRPPYALRGKS